MMTIFITVALVVIIHTISYVSRTYYWLTQQKIPVHPAFQPVQEFRVYESRPVTLQIGPIRYIEDKDLMGKEVAEKRRERIEYQAAMALAEEMSKRGLIDFRHYKDRYSVMPFHENLMTAKILVHKPEP